LKRVIEVGVLADPDIYHRVTGTILGRHPAWPDGARSKRSWVHHDWFDAVARSDLGQAHNAIEGVLGPTATANADVLGQRPGIVNARRARDTIEDRIRIDIIVCVCRSVDHHAPNLVAGREMRRSRSAAQSYRSARRLDLGCSLNRMAIPNPVIWGEAVRKALNPGAERDANEVDAGVEQALLDKEELREMERSELYGESIRAPQPTRLRSIVDRLVRHSP
jgi:hypothetical protein